jgi:hypothetical protein
MLDFVTGMAAAAGFFYVLAALFRPKYFFFISFFAVFLVPGLISIEAPQAHRTIITIPAVIYFAVVYMKRMAAAVKAGTAQKAAALIVLLLLAAAENVYVYFGPQARDQRCGEAFYEDQYQTVKYINGIEKGWRIIVYKDLFLYNQAFYFIAGGREKEFEVFDPNNPFPKNPGPAEAGAVFVFPRNYRPVSDVLLRIYPGAEKIEGRDPYSGHEFIFTAIRVPRQDIADWNVEGQKHGLTGSYYKSPGWKGKPVLTEKKQLIVYEWLKQPVQAPSSAAWTGRIKIETPGEYVFAIQSRDYADLYIDGKKAVVNKGLDTMDEKTAAAEGSVNLSAGFHEIRLRQDVLRYYLRLNLWWKMPGETKMRLVPPDVLYYNDD